jgi:hypothetical protein
MEDMVEHTHERAGTPARRTRRREDKGLGAQIELMMRERERLLQAAGAAAALFATLDVRDLPREARGSLCRLGATLASLSDETLADALEQVLGAVDGQPSPAHP